MDYESTKNHASKVGLQELTFINFIKYVTIGGQYSLDARSLVFWSLKSLCKNMENMIT